MIYRHIQRAACFTLVAFAAAHCTGNAGISENGSAVSAEVFTGRFIDAPVQGVEYSTSTQRGITDADGNFRYQAGEQVTFSIGKTVLGSGPAIAYMTPEHLSASGTGLSDQSVINMLRFLQTVDSDGVAENGIEIRQAVRDLLAGTTINFNQTVSAFDADVVVKAVVQVSRGSVVPLVSDATATANFLGYRFSGSFTDNYGGKHFLTAGTWQLKDDWTNQTDTITKINGQAGYFIVQKSAADAYNASKFQKVVYISNSDGSFYTCTLSPFNSNDAATAEAITDNTTKTNPLTGGCSGFSWTKLSPVKNPLIGKWRDAYSGKHTISVSNWVSDYGTPSTDAIIRYNAIDGYLVIQKSASDTYNPSKYQKMILTEFSGSWYTCTVSPFDSATANAAAAIADTTTKTNPAASGCGGFSWTQLLP
ncbi:hypothetical protein [Turneriella parva]|uniref:Lipoprotein n=1 Tax=Turneriella parva (strain ATCC BAA-1111 / DSM 21527 / NCTC 11395 / H) TaxID=869212 RepID=I4B1A9_TURPD|nr:hypothetical protein [Turneriella parva]AFM11066.1 hypothetical protein Turpa_0410 [Turneriella parva DSM 21527]